MAGERVEGEVEGRERVKGKGKEEEGEQTELLQHLTKGREGGREEERDGTGKGGCTRDEKGE